MVSVSRACMAAYGLWLPMYVLALRPTQTWHKQYPNRMYMYSIDLVQKGPCRVNPNADLVTSVVLLYL